MSYQGDYGPSPDWGASAGNLLALILGLPEMRRERQQRRQLEQWLTEAEGAIRAHREQEAAYGRQEAGQPVSPTALEPMPATQPGTPLLGDLFGMRGGTNPETGMFPQRQPGGIAQMILGPRAAPGPPSLNAPALSDIGLAAPFTPPRLTQPPPLYEDPNVTTPLTLAGMRTGRDYLKGIGPNPSEQARMETDLLKAQWGLSGRQNVAETQGGTARDVAAMNIAGRDKIAAGQREQGRLRAQIDLLIAQGHDRTSTLNNIRTAISQANDNLVSLTNQASTAGGTAQSEYYQDEIEKEKGRLAALQEGYNQASAAPELPPAARTVPGTSATGEVPTKTPLTGAAGTAGVRGYGAAAGLPPLFGTQPTRGRPSAPVVGATERNTRIREAGESARAATRITATKEKPPYTVAQAQTIEGLYSSYFQKVARGTWVRSYDDATGQAREDFQMQATGRPWDFFTDAQRKAALRKLTTAQESLRKLGVEPAATPNREPPARPRPAARKGTGGPAADLARLGPKAFVALYRGRGAPDDLIRRGMREAGVSAAKIEEALRQ